MPLEGVANAGDRMERRACVDGRLADLGRTLAKARRVVAERIDAFDAMLGCRGAAPGFGHTHVVDLGKTTRPDLPGVYRRSWANDPHPTPVGVSLVAQRLAAAIQQATTPAMRTTTKSHGSRGK